MVTLYLTRLASISYLSNELERKMPIPLVPPFVCYCAGVMFHRDTHGSYSSLNKHTHSAQMCVHLYSKYPLSRTYLTLQVEQIHTQWLLMCSSSSTASLTWQKDMGCSQSRIWQLEQIHTGCSYMCSSLSLQLVLYSSWSKHTLAAQMCCSLSTTGVPSYFPCKLNPLKHHSHLQPCSFRYLTPVQICLEFKMILPNTFHQSAPSHFSENIGRKQKPPNHQESTI